jgi:Mce-associated membrane protein
VTADEKSVEETAEVKADAEVTEVAEATVEAEGAADTEDAVAAEETKRIDDDDPRPGRLKRFNGRVKALSSGRILTALFVFLVVASLSLLGGLFYHWYLPDRATDAAAAKAAISAASEGTVAVLSYSPNTVDNDISSAKSHLTAPFLTYYDQFSNQIVAPAAKQKSVKQSTVVLRAALSELRADSAVVLLFVNQSTQSADRPEPSMTNSSVQVTLTKADGKWLISSFTPL